MLKRWNPVVTHVLPRDLCMEEATLWILISWPSNPAFQLSSLQVFSNDSDKHHSFAFSISPGLSRKLSDRVRKADEKFHYYSASTSPGSWVRGPQLQTPEYCPQNTCWTLGPQQSHELIILWKDSSPMVWSMGPEEYCRSKRSIRKETEVSC